MYSLLLQLILIGLVLWAWLWVLQSSAVLEHRSGRHVPVFGGGGVVMMMMVLLLGGWQLLIPLQRQLLRLLAPTANPVVVVVLLLSSVLWLGFLLGIGIGAWQKPADKPPIAPFGYRRRR
jgi:hypothetical protein